MRAWYLSYGCSQYEFDKLKKAWFRQQEQVRLYSRASAVVPTLRPSLLHLILGHPNTGRLVKGGLIFSVAIVSSLSQ